MGPNHSMTDCTLADMGRSAELSRWMRAWTRGRGHEFRPANLGIPAAVCSRCGLTVTARARIFDLERVWFVDCPDWPSPHLLRRAVQNVPECGLSLVQAVMES